MLDLFSHLWPWILGCLAVGGATGYLTQRKEREHGVAAWLVWAGLAIAAALVAALLGVLAGRAGVWLETAVAAFTAFLAGSAVGTLARGGSLREHEGWALGLIPAALLWLGANLFGTPGYESALKNKVAAAIERAGAKAAKITVDGRDVTLAKETGSEAAALLGAVGNLAGVRSIKTIEDEAAALAQKAEETVSKTVEAGKAATEKAWNETVKAAGEKTSAAVKRAEDAGAKAIDAGKAAAGKAADAVKAAAKKAWVDPGSLGKGAGSPAAAPAADASSGAGGVTVDKSKAGAVLAALPAQGELDAAACQSALSATVALEKIQFRTASATIRLASAKVLDKLAALLQRCPKSNVEIGGHTDNVGDDESNDALSQRRADSVVKYLEREGVAKGRLTAVGYGAKKPIASNDGEEGRAENRRIEFVVK